MQGDFKSWFLRAGILGEHFIKLQCSRKSMKSKVSYYHIRGLFGGDFNLVVWRIFIGSPNLNYAVLTPTHEMN